MSGVLVGRHDGRVSAESIIAIPKDWTEILLGCPWVGVGMRPADGCLVIGTDKNEELLSQVAVATSGRIAVPMEVLREAHIRDQVVMVGCVRCICVWARERFAADDRSDETLNALIDETVI